MMKINHGDKYILTYRLSPVWQYRCQELYLRLNKNGENHIRELNISKFGNHDNVAYNLISLLLIRTYMGCVLSPPIWYTTRRCAWFPNERRLTLVGHFVHVRSRGYLPMTVLVFNWLAATWGIIILPKMQQLSLFEIYYPLTPWQHKA